MSHPGVDSSAIYAPLPDGDTWMEDSNDNDIQHLQDQFQQVRVTDNDSLKDARRSLKEDEKPSSVIIKMQLTDTIRNFIDACTSSNVTLHEANIILPFFLSNDLRSLWKCRVQSSIWTTVVGMATETFGWGTKKWKEIRDLLESFYDTQGPLRKGLKKQSRFLRDIKSSARRSVTAVYAISADTSDHPDFKPTKKDKAIGDVIPDPFFTFNNNSEIVFYTSDLFDKATGLRDLEFLEFLNGYFDFARQIKFDLDQTIKFITWFMSDPLKAMWKEEVRQRKEQLSLYRLCLAIGFKLYGRNSSEFQRVKQLVNHHYDVSIVLIHYKRRAFFPRMFRYIKQHARETVKVKMVPLDYEFQRDENPVEFNMITVNHKRQHPAHKYGTNITNTATRSFASKKRQIQSKAQLNSTSNPKTRLDIPTAILGGISIVETGAKRAEKVPPRASLKSGPLTVGASSGTKKTDVIAKPQTLITDKKTTGPKRVEKATTAKKNVPQHVKDGNILQNC